jgi:hypothetical protein
MTEDRRSTACRICGTPRVGNFRYCRTCGFDHDSDPRRPVHRTAVWPEELESPVEADRQVQGGEPAKPEPANPERAAAVAEPPPRSPVDTVLTPYPPPGVGHEAVARISRGHIRRVPGRWTINAIAALVAAVLIAASFWLLRPSSTLLRPPGSPAPSIAAQGSGGLLPDPTVVVSAGAASDGTSSAPPTRARIGINEPENGSSVPGDRVTFRGTGPAGFELVYDAESDPDTHLTIPPDGNWSLDVDLDPGINLVTLRLGSDLSTELTWTVNAVGASTPAQPAATASPG